MNEIHYDNTDLTGETLYFLIRNSAGNVNDEAAGDGSFEAYVGANIADYDHILTENGDGGGHFVGSFNTDITVKGRYYLSIYHRQGAAVADGDPVVGNDKTEWSGTAEETEAATALNTAIPGSPVANSINQRVKAMDELTETGGDGDLMETNLAAIAARDDSALAMGAAQAVDTLTEAGGAGDLEAVLADTNAIDTLTKASGAGDLAAMAASVVTTLLAKTGITAGGTWTFEKIMKVLTAWAAGKWQDKAGSPGTYEVLDPDDGTTVIAEVTPSETTPQKLVTIL